MTIRTKRGLHKPDALHVWQIALENYDTALKALQRQPGGRKRDLLSRLDTLLYTQIPLTISSRTPCHITAREYVLIVEWKLRRGRWRHQALPFARMAKEKDVVTASIKAFRWLETGDIGKAFDALLPILGCSPAVASCVLSVRDPSVPFLSVELLKSVIGEVRFFRETFLKVVECVRAKARQLSRMDSGRTWTSVDVEKALFVKTRLWSGLRDWDIGEIGDVGMMECSMNEMGCSMNEGQDAMQEATQEIGRADREECEIEETRVLKERYARRIRRSVRVGSRVEVVTGDVDVDVDVEEEWAEGGKKAMKRVSC